MIEEIGFDEKIDLVDKLRELREDWSDEIPQEEKHSTSENNKYKVRGAWFDSVVADVWLLLEDKVITKEESKKAANELINKFTTEEFKNRELTTKEDIQTANKLIDEILANI
jgi:hypothetical protein